jgi:hypothetical protein
MKVGQEALSAFYDAHQPGDIAAAHWLDDPAPGVGPQCQHTPCHDLGRQADDAGRFGKILEKILMRIGKMCVETK